MIDFEVVTLSRFEKEKNKKLFFLFKSIFSILTQSLTIQLMKRFARMTILLLFSVSLFLSSAKPAAALDLSFFTNLFSTQRNVDKTIDAVVKSQDEGIPSHESFVDDNTQNLQSSLFLTLNGPPASALANLNEEQQRIVYERYGRGVIGEVTNAMAALYTPPASTRTYIADVMESAHIIPQAQAQGLGFSSLDPILETWKVFRNVAYMFFVIAFLAIGFMIMFRAKLSGQTVVTAQQAIPGIIISLIFVTFSYAIAGFMIDLMYLLMYLMIGLFQPIGGTDSLNKNFIELGMSLITGEGGAQTGAFQTVNDAVQNFSKATIGTGLVRDAFTWVGGITLGLIVSIAILIAVFKMFFELLKTYVALMVSIVTAPLMLMIGAIPGKNNFFTWIKILIGNLMAYPTVLMAIIIYEIFTRQDTVTHAGFLPPYLLGAGEGSVIITLVGIGIILIIPDLIKEVKKIFGAEGGIWEQLAGKMMAQAGEGAPIGARIAGAGVGLAGGGLLGLERGFRKTRGIENWRDRLSIVGQYARRGLGDGMASGTRFGGSMAAAVGGKTPAALGFVEKGIDTAGQHFDEPKVLERLSKGQNWLGLGGEEKELTFQQKLNIANAERQQAFKEKHGGELKDLKNKK